MTLQDLIEKINARIFILVLLIVPALILGLAALFMAPGIEAYEKIGALAGAFGFAAFIYGMFSL